VLSFDMWCLEMQLYPQARCDTRRPEDVHDYEAYRAAVERFDAEREAQAARDRALQQRLDADRNANHAGDGPAQ
jgi:hypothetical protein